MRALTLTVAAMVCLSAAGGFSDCRLARRPHQEVRAGAALLVDAAARVYAVTEPSALTQGYLGPKGRYFEVALRSVRLESFPCSSCHDGSESSDGGSRGAHFDVKPTHPKEAGQRCSSCHSPRDVARLVLRSGETAGLDHAYRLCGECHFAQAEAWAGGGHGKRLATWEGRRVVLNCTGCHDPHRPTFPRRLPRPGPTVSRGGSRSP